MRFIIVPEPFTLYDPLTDLPTMGPQVTWKDGIRALFSDPRFVQSLDVFTAIDLRKKLLRAAAGGVVELSDSEWQVLSDVTMQPRTLAPAFVYSAEGFFRAITGAATQDPRKKEAPVTDAAAC